MIISAGALAANGLLRLAALTGEDRYEEPARRALQLVARPMASHPTAFAYALGALERVVTAPLEIAIVGDPTDARTHALRRVVTQRFVPAAVTLTGPAGDVSPLLAGRAALDDAPTAYVCEHYTCQMPVTAPEALGAQIDGVLAARQRAAT